MVESVEYKVGLKSPLSVILKIYNLRPGNYGAQSDHIVNGSGKYIVYEKSVVLVAAAFEQISDTVHTDELVGGTTKHNRIGLVHIVIDIGL